MSVDIWNFGGTMYTGSSVMGRRRWRRRDLEDVADVEDKLSQKKPIAEKEQPARKRPPEANP